MRYTETRLAPIAQKDFLKKLARDVSYSNNFDGSQQEPDVLPTQLPFVIKWIFRDSCWDGNKHTTHNLGEVVDGLIALIKNKEINETKLSQIILNQTSNRRRINTQ